MAARLAYERAAEMADAADQEHLARVCALIELAVDSPERALQAVAPWSKDPEADPYERATTRLVIAAALRQMARPEEAEDMEKTAADTLQTLGANLALERKKWGP